VARTVKWRNQKAGKGGKEKRVEMLKIRKGKFGKIGGKKLT
jgi:hypothetical protein